MTANYSDVNNFVVIADDDRDPYVSWANHLERGSAGGVDCVARVGTPLFAPADCTLSNIPNNGTGGNTINMNFGDGWRDQFMHASAFVAPGFKRKGELVGYSGQSASPGAPHVHWHRIGPDGKRYNPWNYFTAAAGLPGGGTTLVLGKEDQPMLFLKLGTTPALYALAGTSPGTPANWLETSDGAFANQLAAQTGTAAALSAGSFEAWKKAYLAPVNGVAAGTPGAPADNTAILAALEALTAAVVAKPNAPSAEAIAKAIIAEQKLPGN